MPSFKNLEMAAAVSAYENISVSNSFFGLSRKVTYTPTQSPVAVRIYEYAPAEGERLERLLSLPLDKLESELQAKGKPVSVPVGHFRLEVCLSADRQFCALQLFRFADFKYAPCFPTRFYEGEDVATIVKVL